MHPYIKKLNDRYAANANQAIAASAKAYLRNQFGCFGIPSPLRRSIGKEYMKEGLPPYDQLEDIIRQLWLLPEREFQYFAIELVAKYRKEWKENIIRLFEHLLTHKSWWDTVDYINSELVGPYFKLYPAGLKKITGRWNQSQDLWLQRSSILFQKNYKHDLDKSLLTKYILHLQPSREFFIQKAIGWTLREYSKTNPAWVKEFVQEHALAPLSKREALKWITRGAAKKLL